MTHHTSHIAYHIWIEVLKEIRDNDGGALWQFIKTNPQKGQSIFFVWKSPHGQQKCIEPFQN